MTTDTVLKVQAARLISEGEAAERDAAIARVVEELKAEQERQAQEAAAKVEQERRAKEVAAERKVAARQAAVAENALQDLAGAVKTILSLSEEAIPSRTAHIITERVRFLLGYGGLKDLREARMPNDDAPLTETIRA